MPSLYNSHSNDGLIAFWKACEIPNDVISHPFTEGENVALTFLVLSNYMLREVGLHFPLPLDVSFLLNEHRLSLECCHPNVLHLLLGISVVY